MNFGWLARQAADGMRWAWPVSVVLVGAFVVSTVAMMLRGRGWPPFRWEWQLVFLLNPVAILAISAVWACEHCSPSSVGYGVRHVWAMRAADALFFAQLFAAVWSVWRASGCGLDRCPGQARRHSSAVAAKT